MHNTLLISPALEQTERIIPVITFTNTVERLPFRTVRRILVPFDLSRASVSALRVVAGLAEKTGAAIHLLHVVRPSEPNGIEPKSSRTDDKIAETTERLLKHWVKRVVRGRVKTFVSIR